MNSKSISKLFEYQNTCSKLTQDNKWGLFKLDLSSPKMHEIQSRIWKTQQVFEQNITEFKLDSKSYSNYFSSICAFDHRTLLHFNKVGCFKICKTLEGTFAILHPKTIWRISFFFCISQLTTLRVSKNKIYFEPYFAWSEKYKLWDRECSENAK